MDTEERHQAPPAPEPENTVEIRIPSDPRMLKIIRMTVSHLCEVMGFSSEDQKSTVLAVDEACSNIIKHAYQGETTHPIWITFELLPQGLKVKLRDFGRRADIKRIKPRALHDIRPGGIGVHVIKSVMDVVQYDNTVEKGNELTLIKYLRGEKEEAC